MSFTRRFGGESEDLRGDLEQAFKIQNQKIDLIRSVKEIVANLMTNDVKQIERILLKVIEMLKTDLKKDVKNTSKLSRTLNRIENRLLKIEKQNANQSIRAETYASVMKTVTKVIRNENEEQSVDKKAATTNIVTARKKKELIIRIKNDVEKTKLRLMSDVKFLKRIKRATKEFKSEAIELK